MVNRTHLILGLLLLGAASVGYGDIGGNTPLKIDFTQPVEVAQQIVWFNSQHLGVSKKGFGWEGEKNTRRDGWIETPSVGSKKSMATGVPMAQLMFGTSPSLGLILLPIMIYHPLQLIICGALANRWKALAVTEK